NAELPRQDLGISSRSPGSTNAAVERREARAPSLLPEQAEGNEGARDASLGVPACRVMARLGAAFRTSASRRSAPSSGHGMKAQPAATKVGNDLPERRSFDFLQVKKRGAEGSPPPPGRAPTRHSPLHRPVGARPVGVRPPPLYTPPQ